MDPADGIKICHCVGVRRGALVRAIAAGCRTVDDLRRATGACTGCSSCWPDLTRLLAEQARPPAGPRAP